MPRGTFAMNDYKEWAFSLVTGGVVGLVFARLKLPVPAPPTMSGVLGIVGIALGYLLGRR